MAGFKNGKPYKGEQEEKSYGEMVAEFKRAFGCEMPFPSKRDCNVKYSERMNMLRGLISEEHEEFKKSTTSENELKEICDKIYVEIGYAHERYGPEAVDKAFAEVHRSNMSKLGDDGKPVLRDDGKILKGPNYSPADISKVLDECRNQEHTTGAR